MEVRDPIEHSLALRCVYIRFFWTRCEVCGKEYRKTAMWRWKEYFGDDPTYNYACQECLPTVDACLEHIKKHSLTYLVDARSMRDKRIVPPQGGTGERPAPPPQPPQPPQLPRRPAGHLITEGELVTHWVDGY